MYNKKNIKSAVSLVELAIVILVLGILVAVVTGSNSLVKAAKVRKVVNEVNVLVAAHRTFESTYDAVAGDMIDAYDFFGTSCVGSTASAYCNGDGDLKVEGTSTADTGTTSGDLEYLRYFQHLQLANVIEGDYPGDAVSASDNSSSCDDTAAISSACLRARNYNVPKTQISNSGYYTVSYDSTHEKNIIILGDTDTSNYNGINDYSLVSALDAKSIDLKLDDGLAATGKVRGKNGADTSTSCLGGGTTYSVTTTGDNCYLEYVIR